VHVRRTDKLKGEARLHAIEEYMQVGRVGQAEQSVPQAYRLHRLAGCRLQAAGLHDEASDVQGCDVQIVCGGGDVEVISDMSSSSPMTQ